MGLPLYCRSNSWPWFWSEAVNAATHLRNWLISRASLTDVTSHPRERRIKSATWSLLVVYVMPGSLRSNRNPSHPKQVLPYKWLCFGTEKVPWSLPRQKYQFSISSVSFTRWGGIWGSPLLKYVTSPFLVGGDDPCLHRWFLCWASWRRNGSFGYGRPWDEGWAKWERMRLNPRYKYLTSGCEFEEPEESKLKSLPT